MGKRVYEDDPPLTQTYDFKGTTINIYGELDVKTFAKSLLAIYNKKNHKGKD